MSHFAVAVILKDIRDLEKELAPFDENLEVPKYIKLTKEQAIQKVRAQKDFPKESNLTDEQCYEHERSYYNDDMVDEEGNLYSTYNPNSRFDYWLLCSYDSDLARFGDEKMPLGYCKIKEFKEKFNDLTDVLSFFHAFVLNSGWHERNRIYAFGMCDTREETNNNYLEDFMKIINDSKYQEYYIAVVDCHM